MQVGAIAGGLLAALALALVVASITDIRRRQIDNKLNGAIALAAPLYWWAAGLGWPAIGWQLGASAATLLFFGLMFARGYMGGGDVKLLAALALWIRPDRFLNLLVAMALAGGVLTLAMLIRHRLGARTEKLEVPYGIAISAAGLWILAIAYLPLLRAGAALG
ncbi:MAG TPA: prepilin peptidase [Novosphingobium sp.]|nr:prepilin peptidase [Novosphingobium sp.]HZV09605.1 prepilin peptidase [Novosphingobium sp.]